MATPICTHIGKLFKTMRNTMVDLFLVRIRFCVRLADTFGNNICVALRVASVLAILALHTGGVFQEVTA